MPYFNPTLHTCLQYVNDISIIWTDGLDKLKSFIDCQKLSLYLSQVYTPLLMYLSLTLMSLELIMVASVLTPTEKHQHLLCYSSCHMILSLL